MSSKIKCPIKKESKRRKKEKSHESCDILLLPKNEKDKETMGRKHLILESTPRGTHFTWEERLRLQYYYCGSNGYSKITSPALLARIFNKSRRTIAREIKRGLVIHARSNPPFETEEYNAEHAQLDAEAKMGAKGPMPKSGRHHDLVALISHLILDCHYSPYAAICHLSHSNLWPEGVRICEKTLYNWIDVGDIPEVTVQDLPRRGKQKRRWKGHGKPKHSRAECASRSIDKRPSDINERLGFGHWEGDTVYSAKNGSRTCLLTLVERKTRVQIIRKIADRSAASVISEIDKIERLAGSASFSMIFRSMTFDNGMEFSDANGIERSVLTKGRTMLFYAHPYCSFERGTNENANGIIRRFLPKGTDFALIQKSSVRKIQDWMNNYPRRILDGKTPLMAFFEEVPDIHRIRKLLEVC